MCMWGYFAIVYLFVSDVILPVQKPEEKYLKPFITYKLIKTDISKINLASSWSSTSLTHLKRPVTLRIDSI